ncbi:MAG: glutamine-hydrolyzing GMP synthase, partial [Elusimicrobia bacterium RIFCSPHIGHO2_01_FULL_64_10]
MIVVLDFGSQTTQLIARRVREKKVYCEILPHSASWAEIEGRSLKGIILSGGPASVNGRAGSPSCDPGILDGRVPVLGICYGMQLLAHAGGGRVSRAAKREFGRAEIQIERPSELFRGLESRLTVWMSHGDEVQAMPEGFQRLAGTSNAGLAAISHPGKKLYGVQFHPEVAHTPKGPEILSNFIFNVCGESPSWKMSSFVETEVERIRSQVGKDTAVCALSGGVDSAVAAALAHRAIGGQLHCVFVDHGLQRHGETERVRKVFGGIFGERLKIVNARARFLKKLKGVGDPEKKRKIIGTEFIRVFESESKKIGKIRYLVQGTLYPDLIESQSVRGPSAVIKTHHNVGGLPKNMRLSLVEPLKSLFKDEVRLLGAELGLPNEILLRQPFPGPGLAVRVLGPVDEENIAMVREADRIVEEEIRAAGIYEQIWQAFAVLIPVRTVGVMGDARTYEQVIAVRAVTSQDAMTADWADIPRNVLARISNRIINEVRGVNR